ncbi:MAG: hypothetical protein A2X22_08100 [Bacteroidetes bacterium GWF2_49_14]|nr:MAG: hypothetical protein A2X22_08100 [Bacteroidetes bacterium GWF2_49_14]
MLLLLSAVQVQGQLWYLTRGTDADEVAWGVDADSLGSVYWAVAEKNQWPFWYYNITLYKIRPDAAQGWKSPSWGSGFNDIAFKATVSGEHVYLSGRTDSTALPVSGDAMVICFNTSTGTFDWTYVYKPVPDYGYDEIDGLVVRPDGIYLTGWKQQQQANNMDFLIQKISHSGNLVWTSTWDYNGLGRFDGANGHCAIDDRCIYAAGHVNRTNIGSVDGDGALACFSRTNGALQWQVTWGGLLFDDALGLAMSADSILYMTGYTASFGNGSQNFLNKYSRTGELIWSRIWGGRGTEDCRSLVTDGDSLIFVVGATSSYGHGGKDVFVLKYNQNGILIDSLLWGGAYDEIAKDCVRSGDFIYITGETKSYGNGRTNGDHKTDGLLLKINGRTMEAPDSTMTTGTNLVRDETPILDLFPNPCGGIFKLLVSGSDPASTFSLIFIDALGRKVTAMQSIQSGQSLTCNLPDGIYTVRIIKGQTVLGHKRIIMIHDQ